MPFDLERVLEPFTDLAKSTKLSRKELDAERVHKLRTTTRRVEAILSAVQVAKPSAVRKLSRSLRKVRRTAGAVRDMDVLGSKAATISSDAEQDCQTKLLRHLEATRRRNANHLAHILKQNGKAVRRRLKGCGREIKHLMSPREESGLLAEEAHASARGMELAAELRGFGKLDRKNLHEYRKTGKQLRYVLQMAQPKDDKVLEDLREMQDSIGEWHDWEELVAIARDVLEHGSKCELQHQLEMRANEAFKNALTIAAFVRKHSLSAKQKATPLRLVKASGAFVA